MGSSGEKSLALPRKKPSANRDGVVVSLFPRRSCDFSRLEQIGIQLPFYFIYEFFLELLFTSGVLVGIIRIGIGFGLGLLVHLFGDVGFWGFFGGGAFAYYYFYCYHYEADY